MKSLVLLYRRRGRKEVTIREFPHVVENNKHYLFGTKDWVGNREGVLKKCVGEMRIFDDYFGGGAAKYPIVLPSMGDLQWHRGYFIFVNKNKYDENPQFYYNMIKDFRER